MADLKVYKRSFNNTDREITQRILPGSRILEVGCAEGVLTQYLCDEPDCSVTCVELNPAMAEIAQAYAEKMIVGDITSDDTWQEIEGQYGHIVFADVLEHLPYPAEVLRRCSEHLAERGSIIASVPNVAHFSVRLGLLRGRFDYADYGILDSTHLRFYTASTLRKLFSSSGYTATDVVPLYNPRRVRFFSKFLPAGIMRRYTQSRDRCLDRLWPNSHAFRYLVEASKDPRQLKK